MTQLISDSLSLDTQYLIENKSVRTDSKPPHLRETDPTKFVPSYYKTDVNSCRLLLTSTETPARGLRKFITRNFLRNNDMLEERIFQHFNKQPLYLYLQAIAKISIYFSDVFTNFYGLIKTDDSTYPSDLQVNNSLQQNDSFINQFISDTFNHTWNIFKNEYDASATKEDYLRDINNSSVFTFIDLKQKLNIDLKDTATPEDAQDEFTQFFVKKFKKFTTIPSNYEHTLINVGHGILYILYSYFNYLNITLEFTDFTINKMLKKYDNNVLLLLTENTNMTIEFNNEKNELRKADQMKKDIEDDKITQKDLPDESYVSDYKLPQPGKNAQNFIKKFFNKYKLFNQISLYTTDVKGYLHKENREEDLKSNFFQEGEENEDENIFDNLSDTETENEESGEESGEESDDNSFNYSINNIPAPHGFTVMQKEDDKYIHDDDNKFRTVIYMPDHDNSFLHVHTRTIDQFENNEDDFILNDDQKTKLKNFVKSLK
tara:strand:+ start:19 stop:1482 length:1464 start_codon:yes stop_codon:yes gene_type:complete